MKFRITHWLTALLGLSLLICTAAIPTQTQAAKPTAPTAPKTTFSGQATAVNATVLGINTVLSDTGPLPTSGGAQDATLLNASVPNLLTAEVLHAATVAQGNNSRSEASVANLNLTVGGQTITAGFLMARANASCSNGLAAVSGSSEVVGLVINSQAIVVTGAPNQTVALPLGAGQVVINEQSGSASGNVGDLTVTALHVVVNGIADVAISRAHADITCQATPTVIGDFVTGGGWITRSGAKANFGVAGGKKNGLLWGHLTYIDHGTGSPKVKGTGVTAYSIVGNARTSVTRHIEGTCEIDGAGGFTYQVDVADNGEPGRSDTFAITLSSGYAASGTLAGGNIQIHNK